MKWQIVVGNIGTVLDTDSGFKMNTEFSQWKGIVNNATGRAAGETVTIMLRGEVYKEYVPKNAPKQDDAEVEGTWLNEDQRFSLGA